MSLLLLEVWCCDGCGDRLVVQTDDEGQKKLPQKWQSFIAECKTTDPLNNSINLMNPRTIRLDLCDKCKHHIAPLVEALGLKITVSK